MTHFPTTGTFVGRLWLQETGPILVHLRGGVLHDVTTKAAPTMRDLLELPAPLDHLAALPDRPICDLATVLNAQEPQGTRLLAPADLQAIKACGVTFARSMIERVIEERAAGDAARATEIRARIAGVLGTSLRDLKPGSPQAAEVKRLLQAEGLWSQYLEVGIGPDAEVFTKCPPMAAVGQGAAVGLHPVSQWNNPEPEVVLALNSRGTILGATLGNDVNLRDVEGRSALLLGKAKDNNASASIGPLLRLFDNSFTLDDVRGLTLTLTVTGEDGFHLEGRSSMAEISRDPADLAAQTLGRHHQYPDGAFLYCGTMFAPIQDRDGPGQGFTHHIGDVVTIATPMLGALTNTVRLSTEAPEWTFGTGALMRNLAARAFL
ncbi:fumarylacetoacetate hydrolase family protein [Rhodobacter sp. KR11]|uniref:fumarylacetoacetate hydrolase family protein n=1 Tax=Rhodobacter sp. KR11 TaxID=2974588 RepID=UPI002221C16B|nr:fumarylacetoacetate hydrolase family protein [Rhodobacter sp. KR11]MCW1920690.1 fumarylacetoacetate hydrolase family protein [Rhodobacter sp. KR11]